MGQVGQGPPTLKHLHLWNEFLGGYQKILPPLSTLVPINPMFQKIFTILNSEVFITPLSTALKRALKRYFLLDRINSGRQIF